MAASPRWKVYSRQGEYLAAVKYPEDAAALVSCLSDGATIRDGHPARRTVWTEGAEDQPAGESFDHVAHTIADRVAARSTVVTR